MPFTHQLRYASRMLRLNPGFAAVAIVTLGLGIGATTAMFTVLDGVVLKSLRYPDVERLVAVNTKFTDTGRSKWRSTSGDLEDLRADTNSFEALSFYQDWEMGVQVAKSSEFVQAAFVDTNFFHVFSIAPLAGRLFTPDDAERSAVVSLAFAQRNYGSASAALGQTIGISGKLYQIAGVLPAVFDFPDKGQVWAAMSPIPGNRGNRNSYNYSAVAKLRAGVSLELANARLQALGARLAAAFPRDNGDKTFTVTPLQDQLSSTIRSTLFILMGAVGLVLLIACANVANLMLARATARSRELAVRSALGARRSDLILQSLVESAVLAMLAGVLGIELSFVTTKILLSLGASFVPPTLLTGITLDWRVLVFALAAALTTSFLFGIVPAWQATRVNLQDALKQGGTRGLLLGGGSSRLRSGLVIAQIAVSLVLAVGAGLLFRTLLALHGADLGYRTEGILVAYADMPAHTPAEHEAAGRFFEQLIARLRHLPGVIGAADAYGLPTGEYGSNGYLAVDVGQSFQQVLSTSDFRSLPHADFSAASPGYFSIIGMRLLRGRDFNDGDTGDRPLVAIISESLARKAFPNQDPLGHRIGCGFDLVSMKGMTIVGVVSDVRQDSPASQPGPALYVPLGQHPERADQVEVVVRTSGNPDAMLPVVQKTIREMNPQVATKFTTMTELVKDSVSAQRFRSALATSFAGLALLLSISGMYAVMSYVTTRRTSEFGLRSALGAQPGSIVGLVLGDASKMAALGIVAGVLLSLTLGRLLRSMLFGLKSTDLATYAGVVALVAPIIMLAAALPAWRCSQADPMIALRNE
ncbi:MAG TPA: ABC transporter permease [Terriglobales bacterium]|nr:ABC transporter permease [Terriglobales bacterium]